MAKTQFIRQVIDYMYPAKNRVIAAVAFVRTFKQTLTGALAVGGTGLITVNATDVANLTWEIVGYTAVALILTALIAAGTAFDDVSRNGLNSKYMDAATTPAPEVVISADAVKQLVRPAMFVPAPATPIASKPVTAAKPATRKKTARPKATAVANKVVENTLKADQAPAVEEAA